MSLEQILEKLGELKTKSYIRTNGQDLAKGAGGGGEEGGVICNLVGVYLE